MYGSTRSGNPALAGDPPFFGPAGRCHLGIRVRRRPAGAAGVMVAVPASHESAAGGNSNSESDCVTRTLWHQQCDTAGPGRPGSGRPGKAGTLPNSRGQHARLELPSSNHSARLGPDLKKRAEPGLPGPAVPD